MRKREFERRVRDLQRRREPLDDYEATWLWLATAPYEELEQVIGELPAERKDAIRDAPHREWRRRLAR